MAEINIAQSEADSLIAMEKQRADNTRWLFLAGERLAIPLTSMDRRENFILDMTRYQIKITKATYQNRARQAVILMRLDIDGPPHRNPEDKNLGSLSAWSGQLIQCPHLHTYVEGYADKWAIPAPIDRYPDCGNLFATFEAFMVQRNILVRPDFQVGLF